MAQRTIHYLFAQMISSQVALSDKNRFLLGSILPDAIERCNRDTSHFKVQTGTHKYFDFAAFRNQYYDRILRDDLYLGYYMHLVEDAFYRVFMYNDHSARPRTPAEVTVLHQDYHILNNYIVKKYGIQNTLDHTFSLAGESINDIAPFRIDEFLEEMAIDFIEDTKGQTVFLTESMLDAFVETYFPLALQEVKNLKNGASVLSPIDYAWAKKE